MKKISKQIDALETRQQQVSNRLSALRNRQARIDRAKETRKLILAGKFMLRLCHNDYQRLGAQLDGAGMLSDKDKKLFDIK